MLAVLDIHAELAVAPPGPPPICDDGDRSDKCNDCPVRRAMLQREEAVLDAREAVPEWTKVVMGIFGLYLMISQEDLEHVISTRMLTYLPCDGPVKGYRSQWPGLYERVMFSRAVLMCGNMNVPKYMRQIYFEELGEDSGL